MSQPQDNSSKCLEEMIAQLSLEPNDYTLDESSTIPPSSPLASMFPTHSSASDLLNYRDWKESFIDESLSKKTYPKLSNETCLALIDNWLLSLVVGFGAQYQFTEHFKFILLNKILSMQLRDPLDLTKLVFDFHLNDEHDYEHSHAYSNEYLKECKERFNDGLIEEYKVQLVEKSQIHLENGNFKHGTMKDYLDKFCDNLVDNDKAMIFYRWLKQSSADDNAKIALCAFIALCTIRVGVDHVSNMQFLVREKFHVDFSKFYGNIIKDKPTGFPTPNHKILEIFKNVTGPGKCSVLAQSLYICEHDKIVHLRPLLRFAILNAYKFNGLPVIKHYLRACELTGLKGEQFIARYINQSYMKDEFGMILRKYEQMKAQDGMWALNWSRALVPECMFAYSKHSNQLCQLLCDIINAVDGGSKRCKTH